MSFHQNLFASSESEQLELAETQKTQTKTSSR